MARSSGLRPAVVAGAGLVVALVLAAGAWSGSGPASARPPSVQQEETTTTEEPDGTTTAPETTATTEGTTTETTATTEEPTSETTATTPASPTTEQTEPGSDGDDDVDWALIALIAGGALLALVVVGLLVSAASRRAAAARARARHVGDLVSRAEWIHDEASLEVMAATASPERLRTAWADTHRRINDLAAEATALAGRDDYRHTADDLRRLAHALSRLAGALDTHVSLHLQATTDPAVTGALGASTDTVTMRRDELRAAIGPLTART